MPDGLAALRALGVALDAQNGFAFRGVCFLGPGAAVQADFPHGCGLGIRRTLLHKTLAEHASAAGAVLAWGARVEGLTQRGVTVNGSEIRCRWIAGADGTVSRVRKWAGLDTGRISAVRYGFRRHYRVRPWSEYMQLYWGRRRQVYVTGVSPEEVCVTTISRDSRSRLDEAIPEFPEIHERLAGAGEITAERGAITSTRKLKRVARGNVALLGDASGSVDAITGEGLCLAFRQADALAGALAAGSLEQYESAHRRIARRPRFMAGLMLLIENRDRLRARVLRAMRAEPRILEGLLALHVGAVSPSQLLQTGISLGWGISTAA